MPHVNRLAEQSVLFEQAYVIQPVCTPSRASLLTGLYPHTSGCTENNIPLSVSIPCLPEMLTESNHVTAHYGKWHLGDEIFAQHGFQEWRSIEDNYHRYYSENRDQEARSDYHRFLVSEGFTPRNGSSCSRSEATRLPEEYGKPAFLATEASRFIREHRQNPFILYVNFLEPHMPFFGPRDDQYDPAEIPLPFNFTDVPGPDCPLKLRVFREGYRERGHSGLPLKTHGDWQRLIANYWGLCSLVDTHVGKILQTLDECGLTDRTIIVFTSDHGDMMGSHQLLAKCVMFEEAVRIPLLIKLPGQRTQRRVRGPVSQIDLVPTLLDLLGQPVPPHLQGKSLRPWLEQQTAHHDEDVFIEWNGPNSGVIGESRTRFYVPQVLLAEVTEEALAASVLDPVRTVITPDGWKLNYSPLGEHELYHLAEDPYETRNLADEKTHRAHFEELHARIERWQQSTDDTRHQPYSISHKPQTLY